MVNGISVNGLGEVSLEVSANQNAANLISLGELMQINNNLYVIYLCIYIYIYIYNYILE